MKEMPLFSSFEKSISAVVQDGTSCEMLLTYLMTKHAEQQYEDLFSPYLVLAGCALLACPHPLALEESSIVQEALWSALQQTHPSLVHERVSAVLAGLAARDESLRKRYLAFVADPSQNKALRLTFIKALGAYGNADFAKPLLALLLGLKQKDSELLLPLRDALICLEASTLIPEMLGFVQQKELDPRCRGAIAGIVGKLGKWHPDAVPALVAVLLDEEEHETVRLFVASALGDLGDQSVASAMIAMLNAMADADSDVLYSEEGPEQLALFAPGEDQGLEENERTPPGNALKKRCPDMLAVPLVCALEHLLLPSQVPEVIPFLRTWRINDPARKCLATIIVLKATSAVLVKDVLPLVGDRSISQEIRETLALTCGERPDASLLPHLQQITQLGPAERTVERAVLVARYRLGDQTVAKTLKNILGYKNVQTSSHYVRSGLIQCTDLATVLQLMQNREGDLYLRQLAVALLPQRSEQDQREAISSLLQLVRSSQESVDLRREVLKTLEVIGQGRPELEAILPLLREKRFSELTDDACRAVWAICCRMKKTLVTSNKGYQLVSPETLLPEAFYNV